VPNRQTDPKPVPQLGGGCWPTERSPLLSGQKDQATITTATFCYCCLAKASAQQSFSSAEMTNEVGGKPHACHRISTDVTLHARYLHHQLAFDLVATVAALANPLRALVQPTPPCQNCTASRHWAVCRHKAWLHCYGCRPCPLNRAWAAQYCGRCTCHRKRRHIADSGGDGRKNQSFDCTIGRCRPLHQTPSKVAETIPLMLATLLFLWTQGCR
jgi:hypothetical protein